MTGAGTSGESISRSGRKLGEYRLVATAMKSAASRFRLSSSAARFCIGPPPAPSIFSSCSGADSTCPGWHKACHLDDAKLPDGTHLDVTGGWHSAGDYNKPMWQFGDSGVSYALAKAFEAQPQLFSRRRRADTNSPTPWTRPGGEPSSWPRCKTRPTARMRGDVLQGPERTWMKWTAPDVHTDNQIGTADDPVIAAGTANVPLTIAAWVQVARQLSAAGIENDYVERADRLWTLSTAAESAAPIRCC